MRRQYKIAAIVGLAFLLVVILAQQAIAYPDNSAGTTCTQSGCHDDPSAMTITAASSVDVDMGDSFTLDVAVTGEAGQNSLTVKFPTGEGDNDFFDFTIGGLDAEGWIDDGDGSDTNPTTDAVSHLYEIGAPDTPGTFELYLYAAQHRPRGILHIITVNVAFTGTGPAIMNIEGTPAIPVAGENVTVTASITSPVGVDRAVLQYSIDNGTNWENRTMALVGDLYQATIPDFADRTEVVYRIVAYDTADGESISAIFRYIVGDIPLPPPPTIHYGFWLGGPAIAFAYLGTALEYYDEERFTRVHGIMLGVAYFLTLANVLLLFQTSPSAWTALNPKYLIDVTDSLLFVHSWHIWLGIVSMIFGTLAMISHLAGWKTCNLGLPAVILWTILGISGIHLGVFFRM